MNNRLLRVALWVLVLPLAGCSPEAALGEECDTPGGMEDVCEPGTVCGRYVENHPMLTCLKICYDHAECFAGERCNGVDYSYAKACRAD